MNFSVNCQCVDVQNILGDFILWLKNGKVLHQN